MALARPRIIVLPADGGGYYFNVQDRNGEIISTSEIYISHAEAVEGAKNLRRAARLAKVEG